MKSFTVFTVLLVSLLERSSATASLKARQSDLAYFTLEGNQVVPNTAYPNYTISVPRDGKPVAISKYCSALVLPSKFPKHFPSPSKTLSIVRQRY